MSNFILHYKYKKTASSDTVFIQTIV